MSGLAELKLIIMFFIYLIIIFLPSYLIRFSVFGFKANLLDVLLVSFFIFWIIKRLAIEKTGVANLVKNVFRILKHYLFPISLILTGILISTFKSSDLYMSLGIVKSWFVLPIMFFVVAADYLKTEKQKNSVLKIWILSGALTAVASLIYYLGGELTHDGRLKGFFLSPNHLAMFLAPVFIITIWFLNIFKWGSSRNKIVKYFLITGLLGGGIFLTKSLGVIIAVLVALLLFFYKNIRGKKNKIIPALIVLFFLLSALYFLFSVKDFSDRSSLASRFMIWRSAIEILNDNAILGIGPGMFQDKYLAYQYKFEPYLEWAVPQPHNIFLAFWLQTGLLGIVGFLWLVIIFFKNTWSKTDKFAVLSVALITYFLIHGLFDNLYWKNDLAVMFWLIIALSLENKNNSK